MGRVRLDPLEVGVAAAVGLASGLVTAALIAVLGRLTFLGVLFVVSLLFNGSLLTLLGFQLVQAGQRRVHSKAGIAAIADRNDQKVPIEEIVRAASHSFWFWGVSARRTLANPRVQELIREGYRRNTTIRFLVLDPNSPHLERRAREEGDDPEAWKRDIGATIARLSTLAQKVPTEVEFRTYEEFPVWRCVFVNGEIVYVHFYPIGKQGPESPQIVLRRGDNSYYEAFEKEFLEVWTNRSKGV